MAIRIPQIVHAKRILRRILSNSASANLPKGHIAVYVGETERKRFVIPLTCLNHHPFQKLLSWAEEEFGYNHPMGGLTIPCREEVFIDVIGNLYCS